MQARCLTVGLTIINAKTNKVYALCANVWNDEWRENEETETVSVITADHCNVITLQIICSVVQHVFFIFALFSPFFFHSVCF